MPFDKVAVEHAIRDANYEVLLHHLAEARDFDKVRILTRPELLEKLVDSYVPDDRSETPRDEETPTECDGATPTGALSAADEKDFEAVGTEGAIEGAGVDAAAGRSPGVPESQAVSAGAGAEPEKTPQERLFDCYLKPDSRLTDDQQHKIKTSLIAYALKKPNAGMAMVLLAEDPNLSLTDAIRDMPGTSVADKVAPPSWRALSFLCQCYLTTLQQEYRVLSLKLLSLKDRDEKPLDVNPHTRSRINRSHLLVDLVSNNMVGVIMPKPRGNRYYQLLNAFIEAGVDILAEVPMSSVNSSNVFKGLVLLVLLQCCPDLSLEKYPHILRDELQAREDYLASKLDFQELISLAYTHQIALGDALKALNDSAISKLSYIHKFHAGVMQLVLNEPDQLTLARIDDFKKYLQLCPYKESVYDSPITMQNTSQFISALFKKIEEGFDLVAEVGEYLKFVYGKDYGVGFANGQHIADRYRQFSRYLSAICAGPLKDAYTNTLLETWQSSTGRLSLFQETQYARPYLNRLEFLLVANDALLRTLVESGRAFTVSYLGYHSDDKKPMLKAIKEKSSSIGRNGSSVMDDFHRALLRGDFLKIRYTHPGGVQHHSFLGEDIYSYFMGEEIELPYSYRTLLEIPRSAETQEDCSNYLKVLCSRPEWIDLETLNTRVIDPLVQLKGHKEVGAVLKAVNYFITTSEGQYKEQFLYKCSAEAIEWFLRKLNKMSGMFVHFLPVLGAVLASRNAPRPDDRALNAAPAKAATGESGFGAGSGDGMLGAPLANVDGWATGPEGVVPEVDDAWGGVVPFGVPLDSMFGAHSMAVPFAPPASAPPPTAPSARPLPPEGWEAAEEQGLFCNVRVDEAGKLWILIQNNDGSTCLEPMGLDGSHVQERKPPAQKKW